MKPACRIILVTFAGLYLLALALFAIGTLGLFGSEKGPLAAIFLVPLGLPWNLFLDVFPDPAVPWIAAGTPLLNLLLLGGACHYVRRRTG